MIHSKVVKKFPKFLIIMILFVIVMAVAIKTGTASQYNPVEIGAPSSTNYRIYYTDENGNAISPMHDITLLADDESRNVYNMIVEVPRWTNAKMEISRSERLNPIKQDVKDGQLRYVSNFFPYHGYIWNYGAFPQTWENPEHIDPSTGSKGDNDPIDVIEIGSKVAKRGQVLQVKILGIVALIDEGETDWKVITIDVNDPKASQLNDIGDVDKVFPGLLSATIEWFKVYKIPDGKPQNKFAFNGEAKNATFATEIVNETHRFWQSLIKGEIQSNEISTANVCQLDSPSVISRDQGDQILAAAPKGGAIQSVPESLDTWHYIKL